MQLTGTFRQKAIHWADGFDYCCVLDSNSYKDPYGKYDFIVAAGAKQLIQSTASTAFSDLEEFHRNNQAWIFGILGYDLKNGLEVLKSENYDRLYFPELCFFIPEHLIISEGGQLRVEYGDEKLLDLINELKIEPSEHMPVKAITIQARIDKDSYLDKVGILQQHISRGDIYEVTFCQEFFAENAVINPAATYRQLNEKSPTPFSSYLKLQDKYLLCASPERFLKKAGRKLISQPIKGTARRSTDANEDDLIKEKLKSDLKEQTENVMIVDLVRNDLTKSALAGSVKVEEQFGVYSFAQVHQMISTISCTLNPAINAIEAIKNTFPMGSMTGAPKLRAMHLIETQEVSKRGAYSGAMGYFTPAGDFDLNVVIRSILYAEDKKYLSFQVGGAITTASTPENEYVECILKASAILETINSSLK